MTPRVAARLGVALTCLGAAWLTLRTEAVGEEIGGVLTGPFDSANHFGAAMFLVATCTTLCIPRFTRLAAGLGALLILPMASWRLVPGLWCHFGACSTDLPNFVWSNDSLLALTLSALAFGLTFKLAPN